MKTLALLLVGVLSTSADTIAPLPPTEFCKDSGRAAHDGTQIRTPSCVSLEAGELPSADNMVSAFIVNPKYGQKIESNAPFTVDVKVANLATGLFSDPAVDIYQIPQMLDDDGLIQGHSHITIQKLDGVNVPDARKYVFFKALHDKAVDGVLSVEVTEGLPQRGQYRICTMNTSNSHQPVIMPVEERGAQDDCVRIEVG